jgi:hypothetical protein
MQQYTDRLRERYVHQPVQWATLGGLLLIIVGVFGPWATLELNVLGIDANTNGMDHNGTIILILALVAVGAIAAYVFANVNIEQRMLMWGLVIGAVVIDLLVLLDFFDIMGEDGIGIGWGLWLTILGAILFTVGAIVPMWSEIRAKASDMRERGSST